jgi:hypothetical protein
MSTLFEIIKYILPLIGVVIGASLAPFYAKKKRKREIKSELFQNLFHYFSAARSNLYSYNYQCIQDCRRSLVSAQLSSNSNLISREELLRQYSFFKGYVDDHYKASMESYREMLSIEGKIVYLVAEAESYFSKNKAEQIRVQLETFLHSIQAKELMSYNKMNEEELKNAFQKVDSLLNKEYERIYDTNRLAVQFLSTALK